MQCPLPEALGPASRLLAALCWCSCGCLVNRSRNSALGLAALHAIMIAADRKAGRLRRTSLWDINHGGSNFSLSGGQVNCSDGHSVPDCQKL